MIIINNKTKHLYSTLQRTQRLKTEHKTTNNNYIWNRCVFKARRKAGTDSDSLRYTGRSFQSFGAAAKKDESPTRFLEREMKSRVVSDEDLIRCTYRFVKI